MLCKFNSESSSIMTHIRFCISIAGSCSEGSFSCDEGKICVAQKLICNKSPDCEG